DRLVPDRPVRVQHRSGALWIVNSAAAARLRLDEAAEPGVERDGRGHPTGRLWRLDGWLRGRVHGEEHAAPPDLAAVGHRLASLGVTGVTDATPDLDPPTVALLADASGDGRLPQRLHLLGASP